MAYYSVDAEWDSSGKNVLFTVTMYNTLYENIATKSFKGAIVEIGGEDIYMSNDNSISAETLCAMGVDVSTSLNWSVPSDLFVGTTASSSIPEGNGDYTTYSDTLDYCEKYSGTLNAMSGTSLSGTINPSISVNPQGAINTVSMKASYSNWSVGENLELKYIYELYRTINSQQTLITSGQDQSQILTSYVSHTDNARQDVATLQEGQYKLVVNVHKYLKGTTYELGSKKSSYRTTTTTFYPLTDIVTASAPIALDAGNNLLYVDASKCFSSNMGYTPKRYCISHNTDRNPVDTQSNVGIEFIPHTENRDDVAVDVAIFYDTLEGEEKCVVSDEGTVSLVYTSPPIANPPILTQVNNKTFTETPDKASRKANLTYTITPAMSDEIVDAYNIITHLLTKDDAGNELKYYIKLDKALNPHFTQSGTTQYDGTNFSDDAYGGFVQTQVDSTNITGHYPSPLERLDKPLWREDGTSNIQYVEWSGSYYYDVSDGAALDNTKIHILQWGGGVATQLSDCPIEEIENRGNSESDPIEIRTPSELAYLIQVRNSSTDTQDWTYGKYFKISDEIDAFDMNGHQQITLESTASEIKSLYTDTLYNIHPDDYYGNRSQYNWYNSVAPTEKGESIDCHCFSGTLDGNGCIIYNLYSAGTYSCLFPFIGVGATIKNIVLSNSRLWCWTSANSTNGASGLLWGHMDNSEDLRNDNNKNITISNCVVKDCYGSSNGTSLHQIGGILRFVDMNISDCMCADNILEICDKNTDGTTIDNLYIWGGLLGGARQNGWTCNINRCIVMGDDVHPLQICEHNTLDYVYKDDDEDHRVDDDAEWYENGPLYHHDGNGESSDMIYRMVYDLPSDCYSNCYATNKVSESIEFATYLLPSQLKDGLCVKFIDTTVYDKWYLPEISYDNQLIDTSLIVQIDLSNGVEVFNDDGTTKKYEIQSGDIIYLEVIPSIYNHGGYYTATRSSDCLSGETTLKGAYIYVKVNGEYKYCPIYVKTANGYVEGIDMYVKDGNTYVLGT